MDHWQYKVNELRFQYARRGLLYNYSNSPGGSDVAADIPGYAFIGREPYSYIDRTEQRYQITDNFSWTLGRHNTKFGVDFKLHSNYRNLHRELWRCL